MKYQIKWLALVLAFATAVAVSSGCATMVAGKMGDDLDKNYYLNPILSDEIVAIGRPDAELAKEIGQGDVVAFIGLKKTYMLYKGGDQLEQIARLNLDSKRLVIDVEWSRAIFLKDRQVWGDLTLYYGGDKTSFTMEEHEELQRAGFALTQGVGSRYAKKIYIEGVLSPAIKISDEQMAKLKLHRHINFYNPKDSKPPLLTQVWNGALKSTFVVVGIATDIVMLPIYPLFAGVVISKQKAF